MQSDGYVQLRDRAKDVVISGGENISTVEVEQALASHDAVLEAAVIGVPDEKYGERPKAFVVLKPSEEAGEKELIDHVKSKIARYKAPKAVAFLDELPKTRRAKVQRFELREREEAEQDSEVKGEGTLIARPSKRCDDTTLGPADSLSGGEAKVMIQTLRSLTEEEHRERVAAAWAWEQ